MYNIYIKLLNGHWRLYKENIKEKSDVLIYIKTLLEFYPKREIKVYKEISINLKKIQNMKKIT